MFSPGTRFFRCSFLVSALLAQLPLPLLGQAASAGPELKYAVIVSRHGVRSPTWTLDRLNQYSSAPWPEWGVEPGYLTPHGRTLMKMMGGFYRDYYSANKLIGQPDCADAKSVFLHADNDQRTLETARAIAETLLPGCQAAIESLPQGQSDPLFSGNAKMDPALGRAAVMGRIGPNFDALVDANRPAFDVLTQVLTGGGKAKKSIFDDPISLSDSASMAGPLSLASTLSEVFLLEYTNGFQGDKLGWGRLTPANLQQMMSLHATYAELMRRTSYLARTRGGNLLHRITESMEQAVTGKPVAGAIGPVSTHLLVISGHDTNISNLSGMLDLNWRLPSYQPDDAPPGGAIVFSLWKTGAKYAVRLQFVAQTMDQMHNATALSLSAPPVIADLFVPACSTSSAGYPCDWETFSKLR